MMSKFSYYNLLTVALKALLTRHFILKKKKKKKKKLYKIGHVNGCP